VVEAAKAVGFVYPLDEVEFAKIELAMKAPPVANTRSKQAAQK
jgi:hypothetical protein